MKLLMISGDRSVLQGKLGAFWYTLQELRLHFDRIDIICPRVPEQNLGISESGHALTGGAKKGGDVFFHPCPDSLLYQISWIVNKGTSLINQYGHDVMTVHEYPPFYNGIGARRLHNKTRIPYALEIHHIVGMPRAADLSEWIGKILSRLYFAFDATKAAAVRTVNSTVSKTLAKWGVEKRKIQTISSFYLDRDILSTKHKPPVSYDVSFCGRLVANKGLSEVIDAIALIPQARLLVVGDGPERESMEQKVKHLGIANRVTFLGWLPTQEAVSGAIQTARIFVMNSKSEGGPRIALEAMGCGMPIISTRVGVMPEVISDGKNGMFTTGTAKDLAMKIQQLLDDEKQMKRLSKEAVKVLDVYDRKTLIEAYADFLKQCV